MDLSSSSRHRAVVRKFVKKVVVNKEEEEMTVKSNGSDAANQRPLIGRLWLPDL